MNEQLRDEVTGVLAEHEYDVHIEGTIRPACKCGWVADMDWASTDVHDEHVAAALMLLLERREREAAARAWDEGYRTCADDAGGDRWWAETPNPYRADASTEEAS